MNHLPTFSSLPLPGRLGMVLLHSTWLGVLIAIALATVLKGFRRTDPRWRYSAAVVAMLLLPLSAVLTAVLLSLTSQDVASAVSLPSEIIESRALEEVAGKRSAKIVSPLPTVLQTTGAERVIAAPRERGDAARRLRPSPNVRPTWPWLTLIACFWFVGFIIFSAVRVGGWLRLRHLLRRGSPADAAWVATAKSLAGTLRVIRPIRLIVSEQIATPFVTGFLRATIALPATLLTGFPPEYVRAVLAHELAHVCRHDAVFHVVQLWIETIFYYHPAAWWIGRQIDREREHCSDDLAVAAIGSRVVYAKALASLEESRLPVALAASGGGLLPRIQRLLPQTPLERPPNSGWAFLLAASVITVALLAVLPIRNKANAAITPTTRPALATYLPPHGIVRDEQNQPVAGAHVSLFYRRSAAGLGNATVESVSSAADGSFAFTRPLTFETLSGTPDTDHYLILATHDHFAVAWASIFSGGPKPTYDLVFTHPATQAFHVTDKRTGQPIAAAAIQLDQVNARSHPTLHGWFQTANDAPLPTDRTGNDGNATLDGLPQVFNAFTVRATGYAPAYVMIPTPGKSVAEVALTAATRVQGTVRDPSGKGVPGVTVTFAAERNAYFSIQRRTDENGNYAIDDLTPRGGLTWSENWDGDYRVMIQSDDCAASARPFHAEPGQSIDGFDFEVSPGALVHGTLHDAAGTAIVGASLFVDSPGGRLDLHSGPDGKFNFRALPGKAEVNLFRPPLDTYLPGHRNASASVEISQGQAQGSVELKVPERVQPEATLKGRVLKPDGSPAAGIVVHAGTALVNSYSAIGESPSRADGTFEAKHVPVGIPVRLLAEADHRTLVIAQTVILTETPSGNEIGDLRLAASQTVDLQVVDVAGKLLTGHKFSVSPRVGAFETGPSQTLTTDEHGTLHLVGVIAGQAYRISDLSKRNGEKAENSAFRVVLTPIAADGTPNRLPPLVFADGYLIKVSDGRGKTIPIRQITEIQIETDDGLWQMGTPTTILSYLDDNAVLVSREHFLFGKPGKTAHVKFVGSDGAANVATGTISSTGSTIDDLIVQGGTSIQTAGSPAAGPDEYVVRLTDSADKPLKGVEVRNAFAQASAPPLAVTDGDGVVRIAGKMAPYLRSARFDHAGFATKWVQISERGHGLTVILDDATHVGSTLRLPDGKPAASAAITLLTKQLSTSPMYGDLEPLVTRVVADAQGTFDAHVESGEYEIRASCERLFARAQHIRVTAGKANDATLTFAPGKSLDLTFIDSQTGLPIPHVSVCLTERSPARIAPIAGSTHDTDASGHLRYDDLPPGITEIAVSNDGYAQWSSADDVLAKRGVDRMIDDLQFDLSGESLTTTVKLIAGMPVSGRVISTGQRLPDHIWVEVDGLPTGDQRYARPVDKDGRYKLLLPTNLPSAGKTVTLRAVDMQSRQTLATSPPVSLHAGNTPTVDLAVIPVAASQPKADQR